MLSNRFGKLSGLMFIIAILLGGCTDKPILTPAQQWGDIFFAVESRPTPVTVGMHEFLVRAINADNKAAHNLLISIRTSSSAPWKQAIQDGHTGVYRRSLHRDATHQFLYVEAKMNDKVTQLKFELIKDSPQSAE